MTRVLRITLHGGLHEPPVTMVVSERDVAVPLEEAAMVLHNPPDIFVVTEIFESDGSDITMWTADAMVQAEDKAQDESNMSVLYWWTVGYFQVMHDNGVIGTQRSTPLSPDQIIAVFRALAQRSDYRSFQFITHTEEGSDIVEYRGGHAYVNGEVVQAS